MIGGTPIYRSAATALVLQWALRLIGLVSVSVLARLLAPADFGVIGIAMAAVALVEILGAIGLRQALLRLETPSRAHLDTAWTIQLILFCSLGILTLVSAPLVGWLYHDPRLVPVIAILSLRFLFLGLANIGIVDFDRSFRFGADMRMRLAARVASFMITIGAVVVLRNYWALVVGLLTQTAFFAIGSYLAHPYRPRLCLQERAVLLGFSVWMLISATAQTAQQQLERLVAASFGGAHLAGLYSVSKDLSEIFTQEIATALNRVTFVTIASSGTGLHEDHGRLRRTLGCYAMMTAPVGFGLAATAENAISVLLGTQWLEAAPLLQIIAIYSSLYSVYRLIASAFTASGLARRAANISIGGACLTGLLTVVAGAWAKDALIVAGAALTGNLILLSFGLRSLARQAQIGVAHLALPVVRPFVAACCMYFVVRMIDGGFNAPLLQLLLSAVVGASVFAAALGTIWAASCSPDGAEAEAMRLIRAGMARLRGGNASGVLR